MLLNPFGARPFRLSSSVANAASNGVTITASGTANTMGSYTELVASTAFDATWLYVMLGTNASSTVDSSMLVDIGIGAASSEQVLAPTLMAGGAASWAGDSPMIYAFNVFVPAGSRLSARCQSATASRTILANVWIGGGSRIPGRWVGSRITAYGINTAASRGTLITPGTTPSWGTAVQLSSSTGAPIRQVQMGLDYAADLTGGDRRHLTRIGVGASTSWLIEGIPTSESSSELMHLTMANFMLSALDMDIAAGSDLRVAMMANAAEQRSIALYGVD